MTTIEKVHSLFADHVNSLGKLPELKKLSIEIDKEVEDSRRFIAEIKNLFNTIEKAAVVDNEPCSDITRHEDISQFLESSSPKLLLPDMNVLDLDIDESIRKFRTIVVEQKKDILNQSSIHCPDVSNRIDSLDLNEFVTSLEDLCNGLAGIQSIKFDSQSFQKNDELEAKLPQLCQEVELFTKMVQCKTKLSQCNEEWQTKPITANLPYTDIIRNILTVINDVTYKFLECRKMFTCDEN